MRLPREALQISAILSALAVYWGASEMYYARSISPAGISDAADYVSRFGVPQRIRSVQRDGIKYYEFTGRLPGRWVAAYPSSPPEYLFDEEGRFRAWCADPGDSRGYRRTWTLVSTNHLDSDSVMRSLGLR